MNRKDLLTYIEHRKAKASNSREFWAKHFDDAEDKQSKHFQAVYACIAVELRHLLDVANDEESPRS